MSRLGSTPNPIRLVVVRDAAPALNVKTNVKAGRWLGPAARI